MSNMTNQKKENGSPETRIDMEARNEEKQQILPKPNRKKEKNGRKKLRLEFENTTSFLASDKNKHDSKGPDKSNINEHTVIAMDGLDKEAQEEARPKFFGVRNYLHNFYETVAIKNPQLYEDIPDDLTLTDYPNKDGKNCKFRWKLGIAIALITAFVGLICILVGFVTPLHPTIVAKSEEFLIMDRSATVFNEYMRICRLVGVGLFIIGFSLFLTIVLLALCWNIDDGNNEDEEEISENLSLPFNAETTYQQKCPDKAIPTTEAISAVQPKREKEEGVMTKSGLCSPTTKPDN